MGTIYVASQFNYNQKVKGSMPNFGGTLGTTAMKNPDGVDFKSEFKKSDPIDYNFLAYDGSIATSGKPFRNSDYDEAKRNVVYNEGGISIDVVDIASN